jgi:autoinducer 2-degrading protein
MHVVTVLFETTEKDAESFRKIVLQQAHNSLTFEDGCHRFDVCQDKDHANRFFLYEVYEDKGSFDLHLDSAHYQDFSAKTKNWITLKKPLGWALLHA